MNLLGCIGRGPMRLVAGRLMLPGLLLAGAPFSAWGEGGPPQARAEVKYDGTPRPGARITVGLNGPADSETSYQWVQVEGPPVSIAGASASKIELTVPPEARSLGFLVTVKNSLGQRTARVTIPIPSPSPSAPAPTGSPAVALRADAGDDQFGLVGHRITLNGARSTPRVGVVFRWFQLAGPKAEQVVQENAYYAFTPPAPGSYRFGLVLASASSPDDVGISELDEVIVTIGENASAFGGGVTGGITSGVPTAALDQLLVGPGGIAARATLEQTAAVFDSIAARASLYTSLGDLSSEMMRRLDLVIPADPASRQFWTEAVFTPLTQHLVAEMRTVGLDLRAPQGPLQRLEPLQQEKLQTLFTCYAREFRARADVR